MEKKPRLGSDPLEWIRDRESKQERPGRVNRHICE